MGLTQQILLWFTVRYYKRYHWNSLLYLWLQNILIYGIFNIIFTIRSKPNQSGCQLKSLVKRYSKD